MFLGVCKTFLRDEPLRTSVGEARNDQRELEVPLFIDNPYPLNMAEIQSLNFLLACILLTMKYLGSYSFSGSFENISKESNFGEIRTSPVKTAIYRGSGGGLLKRWNVP